MYAERREKFDADYRHLRLLVVAGKMSAQVAKSWIREHGKQVSESQHGMHNKFYKTRADRDLARDLKTIAENEKEDE